MKDSTREISPLRQRMLEDMRLLRAFHLVGTGRGCLRQLL
jgi:hypothetical protein